MDPVWLYLVEEQQRFILWLFARSEFVPAALQRNVTHPGTEPRFLACSSLMMCAFSTTGLPGATFSPRRYRTMVENFDWVFMTWGGCLSTTRELQGKNI